MITGPISFGFSAINSASAQSMGKTNKKKQAKAEGEKKQAKAESNVSNEQSPSDKKLVAQRRADNSQQAVRDRSSFFSRLGEDGSSSQSASKNSKTKTFSPKAKTSFSSDINVLGNANSRVFNNSAAKSSGMVFSNDEMGDDDAVSNKKPSGMVFSDDEMSDDDDDVSNNKLSQNENLKRKREAAKDRAHFFGKLRRSSVQTNPASQRDAPTKASSTFAEAAELKAGGQIKHASGVAVKVNTRAVHEGGSHAWFANESYMNKPTDFTSKTGENFEPKFTSDDTNNAIDGNTWTIWQGDSGDLVVGFQGTNAKSKSIGDVGRDLQSVTQTKLNDKFPDLGFREDATAGTGFLKRAENQFESLQAHLNTLDPQGEHKVTITGHSLGASTTQLVGLLMAKQNAESPTPREIEVEAYNAPSTGNEALVEEYAAVLNDPKARFTSNTFNITGDPVSTVLSQITNAKQLDSNTTTMPAVGNGAANHDMENWNGVEYIP